MAKRTDRKTYRPNAFVPNTSFTGSEAPYILKGENMLIRYSQSGSVYAEGYTGSRDLSETIDYKTLTGSIAWAADDTTITGSGTAFLTELHLGSFVMSTNGPGLSQLFVVEKINSNTEFICSRAPLLPSTGAKGAVVLPVIFPVGVDRGTAVRGNVVQFFKGHYLGVGDGTFKKNNVALSSSLVLTDTPQFALYNPATNTYTLDDFGIDRPAAPPTLIKIACAGSTIVSTTNTNGVLIQLTLSLAEHGLFNGDKVYISSTAGQTGVAMSGEYTVTRVNATVITVGVLGDGAGVGGGGGTFSPKSSVQRAGYYNIRICARNTETNGFSQPTDVTDPVTILVDNESIKITFNSAMHADQNAYDIYSSEFTDNSSGTIMAKYQGPWYFVKTVTANMLKDTGASTPLGTESGTFHIFSFADYEINASQNILSFDNFAAKEAEFVDLLNGIPVFFSCLGKGHTTKLEGTSPGPVAIPAKPSNPEAVVLNKAITTVGGDTIIGEFNAKSRVFVPCQNSLQTLILTTIDTEPIAFRSLWNVGFRNPYNVAFAKEYLYGFSTQGIVRSVAGGDDTSMEFQFTSDITTYVEDWPCGHILTAYDPKNRAMVFFYAAAEKRQSDTYWVTIALPYMFDSQTWNPPIILKKTNQDFIVSGVATIGNELVFLAGGRISSGGYTVGTYVFDGGDDGETYDWFLAWNYADDGIDINAKTIKGAAITGRFDGDVLVKTYGARLEETIDYTFANTASNTITFSDPGSSAIKRRRFKFADAGPYSLYSIMVSGTYDPTTQIDRLDEVVIKVEVNNSEG